MSEIQEAVSRKDSIKRRLSQESWARGIGSFYCDNIPFSYSTGKEFAAQLADLIIELAKEIPDQTLRLAELGAGLGYLSKHVADSLSDKNPALAQKIQLLITDNAPELMKEIHDLGHFNAYEKQLCFEVIDAVSPTFSKPPHGIVMAYMLDSLSTRHIQLLKGEIFEIQVQSRFQTDVPFVDTTGYPPKTLSITEIKELINSPFTERKRLLISRLAEGVVETYRRVPLEKAALSDEEKKELLTFVNWLGKDASGQFNFSFESIRGLKALLAEPTTPKMIGIYDVGFSELFPNTVAFDGLIGGYGATQFYPVFLPLIQYVAEQYGAQVFVSPYPQEKGQLTVVYKGENKKDLQKIWDTIQKKEGGDASGAVGNAIDRFSKELETFSIEVNTALATLSDAEKDSHTLLMSLAIAYKKRNGFDMALQAAGRVIELYGDTAISAWHLVGEIYYYQGEYEKSLEALTNAITHAPDYMGTYHTLSLVYSKINQPEKSLEAALKTLARATSQATIPWSQLMTVILLNLSLKKREEAKDGLRWILKTNSDYPGVFPETYVQNAQKTYDTFFRFGLQNAPKPPR